MPAKDIRRNGYAEQQEGRTISISLFKKDVRQKSGKAKNSGKREREAGSAAKKETPS
jgi:hypothetical protein